MVLNKALFSSKSTEWETPQWLFDELNKEFSFDIDVCATAANTKCERFFSIDNDGLKQEWQDTCWMNPPYGRGTIDHWVKKAYESSLKGATVVCLLPARTDTKWWHNYCQKVNYEDIRFIKGRLKFSGNGKSAPFPSVIVIFRGN